MSLRIFTLNNSNVIFNTERFRLKPLVFPYYDEEILDRVGNDFIKETNAIATNQSLKDQQKITFISIIAVTLIMNLYKKYTTPYNK